jgi:hypothetical protein
MCRSRTAFDGDAPGSPLQIAEDDKNASNTVCDVCGERDITIDCPSRGKIATEKLLSFEALFESSLEKKPSVLLSLSFDALFESSLEKKPSVLRTEDNIPCEAKPVLLHARSQSCLGQSDQDHSDPISSYSRHESPKRLLHRTPRTWDRLQVELIPGHFVPLIGSDETWQAFCADNVIDIECSSCQMFLYCKSTAEMVMCPECRMVSPIDDVGLGAEGLGLGLSVVAAFDMLS